MKHLLTILFVQYWLFAATAQGRLTTLPTDESNTISTIADIAVPAGYERIAVGDDSFGYFLRYMELNTSDNNVYLYNGELKTNQTAQYKVLTLDVGTRDLQQCADAVMRLRAEYLYRKNRYDEIHFNFLGDGKARYYSMYAKGDYSYGKFRKYMNYIFAYANTASLLREMNNRKLADMQIGDVFIQQGNPYGHAVMVIDMAVNTSTGEKIFMLAQSYMPAQNIHVLINPNNPHLSPWYSTNFGGKLHTPEWTFVAADLKTW